jgi:hypothetical protein
VTLQVLTLCKKTKEYFVLELASRKIIYAMLRMTFYRADLVNCLASSSYCLIRTNVVMLIVRLENSFISVLKVLTRLGSELGNFYIFI